MVPRRVIQWIVLDETLGELQLVFQAQIELQHHGPSIAPDVKVAVVARQRFLTQVQFRLQVGRGKLRDRPESVVPGGIGLGLGSQSFLSQGQFVMESLRVDLNVNTIIKEGS